MARKSKRKTPSKSRAENMTGAKAAETEVRELDLKPVEIASDDVQLHIKACKAAKEKVDTANSVLRTCYKNAGKVHKELPGAIRKAITAERDNDPAKLKAELEVLGITLRETGSQIQLSVFDTLAGDPNKQAYERGKADALNGRSATCPFPEGSEPAEHYMTGWRNGIASNLNMGDGGSDTRDAPGIGGDGRVLDPDDNEHEGEGDDIPAHLDRPAEAAHA